MRGGGRGRERKRQKGDDEGGFADIGERRNIKINAILFVMSSI